MLKQLRKHTRIVIWGVIIAFGGWGGFAVSTQLGSDATVAGKVFGKPIYLQEFNEFNKSTLIFSQNAEADRDPDVLRIKTWQNIILSKEAKNQGIKVSDEEVRAEITRLLNEQDIVNPSMDFYTRWLKGALNEEPKSFEEKVREILRSQKLFKKVTDEVIEEPSEESIHAQFQREDRSLNLDILYFPTHDEAHAFLEKLNAETTWEALTEDKKGDLRNTGLVSLDAVINLWRVPKEDAQRVFGFEIDKVSEPISIADRIAVLRVVDKREAAEDKYTDEKKNQIRQRLIDQQTRTFLIEWGLDLQARAALEDLLPQSERRPPPPSEPAPEASSEAIEATVQTVTPDVTPTDSKESNSSASA